MKEKVILCIDDEKMVLNSLKSQLTKNLGEEFIYEFAEDAFEALALIDELINENLVILLIVSDWLMPGMKGDEFLTKVNEKYPNIKSILLTGQADEESIKLAYKNANLLSCIRKPWDENYLIETVKSAINS